MRRCTHWTLRGLYDNGHSWRPLGEFPTRTKAEMAAVEMLVYDRRLQEVEVSPNFDSPEVIANN